MSSADFSNSANIVGAGLTGPLMALLFAQRGIDVDVYERSADPRLNLQTAGRSINLALAERGISALRRAGVYDAIEPLLIPMRGRLLHGMDGTQTFVPYGQKNEAIYSVSRAALNQLLIEKAAAVPQVSLYFEHRCAAASFSSRELHMVGPGNETKALPMQHVIGADGAGSVLRNAMVRELGIASSEMILEHGYKELTITATRDGRHALDANALHLWPRGGFMLIALPNLDGSFTATLFLAREGEPGFSMLDNEVQLKAFFREQFPDVLPLMPDLCTEFFEHPMGIMGTIRCQQWSVADQLLLIGDAAHAIVPFHGQGMNCAFEDCAILSAALEQSDDWQQLFTEFERGRRADTEAIADMALENYLEMRDTVRDPRFQLQKQISLELERRHPRRFVPRYSMVMFHAEISYATAYERGRIQQRLLDELTINMQGLSEIDWNYAASRINELLPPLDG